jgi:hypothetical protein
MFWCKKTCIFSLALVFKNKLVETLHRVLSKSINTKTEGTVISGLWWMCGVVCSMAEHSGQKEGVG